MELCIRDAGGDVHPRISEPSHSCFPRPLSRDRLQARKLANQKHPLDKAEVLYMVFPSIQYHVIGLFTFPPPLTHKKNPVCLHRSPHPLQSSCLSYPANTNVHRYYMNSYYSRSCDKIVYRAHLILLFWKM